MTNASPRTSRVERSVVVEVPVRAAYNQWARFEEFPTFLGGVESVQRLDARRLLWRTAWGERALWEATICDQMPDSRISWRSTTGPLCRGAVSFRWLDDARTQVVFRLEVCDHAGPDGPAALDAMARRMEEDLARFRARVEGADEPGREGRHGQPSDGSLSRRR